MRTRQSSFSSLRETAVDALYKAASLFGRNRTAMVITLLFVIFDSVSLYMLLNLAFAPSHELAMFAAILSLALCLDVPLGIAGTELKKAKQRLCSWKHAIVTLVIAVLAFLLVFMPFFFFRLDTADQMFDLNDGSGLVNMVEAAEADPEESNDATVSGGILLALMPLVTSISSFLLNFILADPLGDQLFCLEQARARLQNKIVKLQAALAEAGDPDTYAGMLFELEEGRCSAMKEKLRTQRLVLQEVFDVLLMQYMADPDAISRIEEHAKQLLSENRIDRSEVKSAEIAA